MQNQAIKSEGNGLVCTCGRHFGIGEWSADQRAASYAHLRQRLPEFCQPHMRDFLRSYEAMHGPVSWRLSDALSSFKDERGHYRQYRPIELVGQDLYLKNRSLP